MVKRIAQIYPMVNLSNLKEKLSNLDYVGRVKLHDCVGRFQWIVNESIADALCEAGLILDERLPTARILERFDEHRRKFAAQKVPL